jgi:hypothetical protein
LTLRATTLHLSFMSVRIEIKSVWRRVEMWRGGLGRAYPCPALSFAGASRAPPCSVSTSRSSNRTCPIKASGSPTGFTDRPTVAPDSAPFVGPYSSFRDRPTVGLGLLDLAVNPLAVGRFHSAPEVRSLPSTGITRLPRYYEPVRHPSAARPVPRGRPVGTPSSHRWGFPCCLSIPHAHMPAPLPRRD